MNGEQGNQGLTRAPGLCDLLEKFTLMIGETHCERRQWPICEDISYKISVQFCCTMVP